MATNDVHRSRPFLRLPGTSIPGLIETGSFGFRRREFWYVRRGKRVMVINLRRGPYVRLVIEVGRKDPLICDLKRVF
jgi:hypothetical protein